MAEAHLFLAMSHPIVVVSIGCGLIAMSRVGYSLRTEMVQFGFSYVLYGVAMLLQVVPLPASWAVNAGVSGFVYLSAVIVFCRTLASIIDKPYPWVFPVVIVCVAVSARVYLAQSGAPGLYVTVSLHAAACVLLLQGLFHSRSLRHGFWADRALWYCILVFALSMLPRLLSIFEHKRDGYGFDMSAFWVVTQITFTVFLILVAMLLIISVMRRRLLVEREISETDFLTGLYNRRGLSLRAGALLKGEPRYALIVIDLDYFKLVNDTYGHVVGDQVLVQVAALFRQTVGSSGLVARLGGEEFLIVLPDVDLQQARNLAQSIRKAVETTPFGGKRARLLCTVSVGVACFDGEVLLRHALPFVDDLLYEAKRTGRNRVVEYPALIRDPGRLDRSTDAMVEPSFGA